MPVRYFHNFNSSRDPSPAAGSSPRPEHQMARAPLGQSSPIRWNQLTLEMPKKYSTYPGHHKARDMLQKVFENIGTTTGARGKRLAARRKEIVRDRAPWSEQHPEEVTDHLCNLKSERFRVTPLRKEHLLYKPTCQAENIKQLSTPLAAQGDPPSSFLWPEAKCVT